MTERISLGFQDINGKAIFTGDTVRVTKGYWKGEVLGVVKYGDYHQKGVYPSFRIGFYANCYGISEDEVDTFGLEVV